MSGQSLNYTSANQRSSVVTGCSRTQAVFDCLAHSCLITSPPRRDDTIASNKFYAVVGGRHSFNGVVTDWENQAKLLTKGVSGVQHKRFTTVAAARQYVADRIGVAAAQVQVFRYDPQLQQQPQALVLAGAVVQLQQVGVAAPAPGEQGGPDVDGQGQ